MFKIVVGTTSLETEDANLFQLVSSMLMKRLDANDQFCSRIPNPEKKIEAIKLVRSLTNVSLREAKEFVEGSRSLPILHQQRTELEKLGFTFVEAR